MGGARALVAKTCRRLRLLNPIHPSSHEAPAGKTESARRRGKDLRAASAEFEILRRLNTRIKPKPRDRDERLPVNICRRPDARPDERTISQTAGMIEKTLAEFGIVATVIGFRVGPTVTQFAVQPGFMKRAGNTEEEAQQIKVRVAQIASLQKDLTLALSAERLRIEAPVPGKPYVGIEVPNSHTAVVRMRSIL
jgi:S-DNA-T family DNA segregation ATPase FtsK/SpoIIIE